MLIKNFNYSEKIITALEVDTTTSEYLWVGFSQDSLGNCAFQKVSAHNPLQIYYNIDLAVDEIKKIYASGSYIYLAYDDTSLIGARYSKSNPLTTSTDFSLPAGITEAPIDLIVSGSYVYFLIPGNLSGTNTKICKFSLAGIFVETIDLPTVTKAISFAVDGSNNFWAVTNTAPSTLVRVFFSGTWQYTIY
jgi:hypothetical protein